MKYIWIKNKKYYYYDRFEEYTKAVLVAKKLTRQNHKNKYFIIKKEIGFAFPVVVYDLYNTKFARL